MFKPLKPEDVDKKIQEIKAVNNKGDTTFKPYLDAYKETFGEKPKGGIPRGIFTNPIYMKHLDNFKKTEQFPMGYQGPTGSIDSNESTGPTGPTGPYMPQKK
jgi:hypothetical protein